MRCCNAFRKIIGLGRRLLQHFVNIYIPFALSFSKDRVKHFDKLRTNGGISMMPGGYSA
jgi:hypothetical protein